MLELKLTINGAVEKPRSFTTADLRDFDSDAVVPDLKQIGGTRSGEAIRIAALVQSVGPHSSATHLVLHASSDGFAASLPLDALSADGFVVFAADGNALTKDNGGPFRFVVLQPAKCGTAELDACSNVKFLDRIEVTIGRGARTLDRDPRRPASYSMMQTASQS